MRQRSSHVVSPLSLHNSPTKQKEEPNRIKIRLEGGLRELSCQLAVLGTRTAERLHRLCMYLHHNAKDLQGNKISRKGSTEKEPFTNP